MFKFKNLSFSVSKHEIQRFFSSSSAALIQVSETQNAQILEPQFTLSLDPKLYTSPLFETAKPPPKSNKFTLKLPSPGRLRTCGSIRCERRQFFHSMWEDHSVRPDVKHYTCMVDLLGRAGRLDEAMELIEKMEVERDDGLWGAFLGACRIHKIIELAEKVAKSLLELQPSNPGHYVLLSNIYANAGRWEDVAKVRELMTHRKLKKIPGWTWIEVNNKIHQFSVGDEARPCSKEIYEMLQRLSEKLVLVVFTGYWDDQ